MKFRCCIGPVDSTPSTTSNRTSIWISGPVGSVTLSPSAPNVIIGTTQTLTATVQDQNGTTVTDRIVNWSSSANNIATVSQAGVVTAVALGTATITATSEGKSGTSTVTVVPVPVGSVVVSPSTNPLHVGQTVQLQTTVKDQNGTTVTNRVVTWGSSDNTIATVNATGKVTAVGAGTATITATSEGKSGTATVTVTLVPVGSVAVSPSAPNVVIGTTQTLTATVKDQNGTTVTDRAVSWSSSATGVATVSSSGVVTGVALGTATITATSEGKSGTAVVTVTPVPVGTITLNPPSASIAARGTATFTATVKDANGTVVTDRPLTWASDNILVATVTQSGVVTGLIPGTANISASAEGKSGTAVVTVGLLPVASVSVTPSPTSVTVGGTQQLTATTKDALGGTLTGRIVTWSSGTPGVATVSSSGLVTGVTAGTAVITATSEGQSGTSTVTVNPAVAAPVATVTLAPPTATIAPNATTTFTPTLKDASNNTLTGRTITWQSSNTAVATVSSTGVVTGLTEGTSTITATSEGKSGTAAVTVQGGPVSTVTVTPSSAGVFVGGTQQLTVTLKDAAGNVLNRAVTWSSNKTQFATVSSTGLVTGVGAGNAVITATSEGKNDTSNITVTVTGVMTMCVVMDPIDGAASSLPAANAEPSPLP